VTQPSHKYAGVPTPAVDCHCCSGCDVIEMLHVIRDVCTKLRWFYFQYSIHLGVCELELWEITLINTSLVLLLVCAAYTTYIFLPGHLLMLLRVAKSITSGIYALGLPFSTTDRTIVEHSTSHPD